MLAVCMCVSVCVHVDVSVCWSANETKFCLSAHAFKKTSQRCFSFYGLFPIKQRPRHPVGFIFFNPWRQDMEFGVPRWLTASTTSHISPSTSCSSNPGCQLPLDALNSWLAWRRKQKQLLLVSTDKSPFSLIRSADH